MGHWILIITIYQTVITPAVFGPDAVSFKPETTVINVSNETTCNQLGKSVIEKNQTRPAKPHPLMKKVEGPAANYSCSKA